jgi:hypothetical protein
MTRRGVYQLELAAASAVLGGVVLVSLLAVTGISRPRSEARDWESPGGGVTTVRAKNKPDDEIHYIGLGAGGCATASCHGGMLTRDDNELPQCDQWKTSAFVFLQQDPHTQAFNVLFEERSREIVNRLASEKPPAPSDPQHIHWYVGQLQEKCVSCHATPLPEDVDVTPQAALNHYALGVTCEACHGPASRWVDEHLGKTWITTCVPGEADVRPAAKRAAGFNNLEDLSVAAVTCARCHIGSGEEVDGKSRRTVSHDLMAAGHPRLDFEFSAWYASMPPHWNRQREQRPGFHTDAWCSGQAGVWNAKAASAAEYPITSSAIIQPDLAQFDCLSCHHALRSPSGYIAGTGYTVPDTSLSFGGSWKLFAPLHGPEVATFNEQLAEYYAGQGATVDASRLAIQIAPAELSQQLASALTPQSWDQSVAWYYAADAVRRDAAFAAKTAKAFQPAADQLDERLKALKSAMEAYVTSSGKISRYASPGRFGLNQLNDDGTTDAKAALLQTALLEVQSSLEAVGKNWPSQATE